MQGLNNEKNKQMIALQVVAIVLLNLVVESKASGDKVSRD